MLVPRLSLGRAFHGELPKILTGSKRSAPAASGASPVQNRSIPTTRPVTEHPHTRYISQTSASVTAKGFGPAARHGATLVRRVAGRGFRASSPAWVPPGCRLRAVWGSGGDGLDHVPY